MLDEKLLRRPTFNEAASAPITLPGGGTWYLPKPILQLRACFVGGKRSGEAILCSDDPEFDRLREAVEKAASDTEADFDGSAIDLAAYMLLKNYDLTDDQLGEAFATIFSSDRGKDWINNVMAMAYGQAPKPSAVG